MSGATPSQRKRHYRTWAAKPGNLRARAQDTREGYRLLKSLGICPRCRKEDVEPGKAVCEACRIQRNEGRLLAKNMKRLWASRYSPGFEPALPQRIEVAA